MSRYLFLLSYFLTMPVFAIYDLVAVNITPSQVGTTFGFQMDTSQTEMYLALYIDGVGFQSILRTKTGELQFAPLQDIKPFLPKGTAMPVGPFGPFTDDTLRSVKLYAGTKAAMDEATIQKEYTQIFNYGIPTLTKEEKPWTLMVYMVGSSLERQTGDSNASDPEKRKTTTKGYASKDILEMLAGTRQSLPNSVNVVLATGGSSREGWKTVKYSLIRDGQLYVLQDLGEQKMSNPQTLSDFVLWAKDQFPAQHYALVLWNHGGGTQGFGQDTTEDRNAKMMPLDQLHDAYQTIRNQLAQPLDVVIYDACLMASIEVAEITHTVANAMAASVEIEPEHGTDYTYLLTQMNHSPPPDGLTVGKWVKEGYINYSKNFKDPKTDNNSFNTKAIAYSVFDLTQLPAVSDALLQFAEEFKKELLDTDFLYLTQNGYKMLSWGIIRAPGYPAAQTGRLLSSLSGKASGIQDETIRIDLYNVLQTVLPDPKYQTLKTAADHILSLIDNQLIKPDYYDGNLATRLEGDESIRTKAGRISIDITIRYDDNSNEIKPPYLGYLSTGYQNLHQCLASYDDKRRKNVLVPEGTFKCPGGQTCAGYKWLELVAEDAAGIDGYYGQLSNNEVIVYFIKSLYRLQALTQDKEIGVNGHEACQYQLCVNDTECENITLSEKYGQLQADILLNEDPAVLTFCQTDSATWTACSVVQQSQGGIWGRDEMLYPEDTLKPTTLHLQMQAGEPTDELTQQSGNTLVVGETPVTLKTTCDMQTATIIASYYGLNGKRQLKKLCDKGDCVCQEDDPDASCRLTNFQFKAGVRIKVK